MEGVLEHSERRTKRAVFGRIVEHWFVVTPVGTRETRIFSLVRAAAAILKDETFVLVTGDAQRHQFRCQTLFEANAWIVALTDASVTEASLAELRRQRIETVMATTVGREGKELRDSMWARTDEAGAERGKPHKSSDWAIRLVMSQRRAVKRSAKSADKQEAEEPKQEESEENNSNVYGQNDDDDGDGSSEEGGAKEASCENVYGAADGSDDKQSENVNGAADSEKGKDEEDDAEAEPEPAEMDAAGEGEEQGADRDGDIPFNDMFQALLNQLAEAKTAYERLDVMEQLMSVNSDFVSCVRRYGKILISERMLPESRKTIKPARMGGVIGGEKYVVQNILFKFAIDGEEGVLGSDYIAAKVCGLEMSAVASCFRAKIPGINFPLTALLDYKGYRLIASSLLNLEAGSLVYGSKDGAQTVKMTRPDLAERVAQLGKALNVKAHAVRQRSDDTDVTMFTAVDVEGHVAADGRFYLLDLSRTMPPVRPAKNVGPKSAYLFRHFRPQFVSAYPLPLCSDAFSRFVAGTASEEEHKREVCAATEYLMATLIPACARDLAAALEAENAGSVRLPEFLHSRGINLRYLGFLAAHMVVEEHQLLVYAEMCARVLKSCLRLKMRQEVVVSVLPLDDSFKRVVCDVLNGGFCSQEYWDATVKPALSEQFYVEPPRLRERLWTVGEGKKDLRVCVLDRICEMTGLRLDGSFHEALGRNSRGIFGQKQAFDEHDVVDIGDRVKSLDVLSAAQAYVQRTRAQMTLAAGNNTVLANRLMQHSLQLLNAALNNSATDLTLLISTGSLLLEMGRVEEGISYFDKALSVNPLCTDAFACKSAAAQQQGKMDEADDYLLQACCLEPDNVNLLARYAELNDKKAPEVALQFRKRIGMIKDRRATFA